MSTIKDQCANLLMRECNISYAQASEVMEEILWIMNLSYDQAEAFGDLDIVTKATIVKKHQDMKND